MYGSTGPGCIGVRVIPAPPCGMGWELVIIYELYIYIYVYICIYIAYKSSIYIYIHYCISRVYIYIYMVPPGTYLLVTFIGIYVGLWLIYMVGDGSSFEFRFTWLRFNKFFSESWILNPKTVQTLHSFLDPRFQFRFLYCHCPYQKIKVQKRQVFCFFSVFYVFILMFWSFKLIQINPD